MDNDERSMDEILKQTPRSMSERLLDVGQQKPVIPTVTDDSVIELELPDRPDDIPTVEVKLVTEAPGQVGVVENERDSMELSRDKTGKYAWKIKMYFNAPTDKDETLCRLMKLNREFWHGYADKPGVK